ncbi:Uncharacterized protein DAT39_007553, partial [Clarias magur]
HPRTELVQGGSMSSWSRQHYTSTGNPTRHITPREPAAPSENTLGVFTLHP